MEDFIVRCKDCIYYRYYGLSNDTVSECTMDHCINPDENWFCADGKRKIESVRSKRSKLVGEVCNKGILWTNIETKEQTLENYD